MFRRAFVSGPILLAIIAGPADLSSGARAEQPAFTWQEGRHFDGRSGHVVEPHDAQWLLPGGTLVLHFTADRLKGIQGLVSKDARGFGDGRNHLHALDPRQAHVTVGWIDVVVVVVVVVDMHRIAHGGSRPGEDDLRLGGDRPTAR